MQDWIFETGGDPMWTLPDQPMPTENDAANWFSPEPTDDFETWLFENPPKGDLDEFGPMFIEGDGDGGGDDDATELDEVVVTGTRIERLPTAVQIEIGDDGELPVGEVGGGGGLDPVDECAWAEFYEDVARQVGILAGALGAIKDSWVTFDPRDDRAIERALIAIDGLEIMLQSQSISYATAHDSISSLLDIMLSEGTDHLAAVFGAAAGGFVTGLFDGPIPAGEVLGGIGGAIAVYLAGDRLPTAAIADVIATLVLAGIDVPPGTPGRPCGGD